MEQSEIFENWPSACWYQQIFRRLAGERITRESCAWVQWAIRAGEPKYSGDYGLTSVAATASYSALPSQRSDTATAFPARLWQTSLIDVCRVELICAQPTRHAKRATGGEVES